ncbi:ecotin family protein [Chishuiella sp.]|uniref:ecotin family protein n=1 Tax=Chishuiella sp. TaxID=1969467 RepID=UPI0028A69E34|nr:ecotin family protein [Chishuiella sp.]
MSICSILSLNTYSQNTPSYPLPKENFKRVDFKLPKIDNPENYKVEITFSMEANVVECSDTDFNFNKNNIETGYGVGNSRFPYYIFNVNGVDLFQGYNGDCNKDKPKITKKIYSNYKNIDNYHYAFPIPYYIPKNWNLEYRIFKAEAEYQILK